MNNINYSFYNQKWVRITFHDGVTLQGKVVDVKGAFLKLLMGSTVDAPRRDVWFSTIKTIEESK
jgi:hypothetical protein